MLIRLKYYGFFFFMNILMCLLLLRRFVSDGGGSIFGVGVHQYISLLKVIQNKRKHIYKRTDNTLSRECLE